MQKNCQICNKSFLTIFNGNKRSYCFDCVPPTDDCNKRTIYKRQALKKKELKDWVVNV